MTTYDPSTAPRERTSGYKGDAWTVSLPPDGSRPILALDTGDDSVAIVRIPDGAWDRGERPPTVHAHDGYDESVVITSGSGTVLHGPDADHITASRFEAPVVVVFPVGAWHHIVMDPGVVALGTCFYTVPGTVIEPFTVQMEIVTPGRVTFADLPVVDPKPVQAGEWAAHPIAGADRRPVRRRLRRPARTRSSHPAIPAAPRRGRPRPAARHRARQPVRHGRPPGARAPAAGSTPTPAAAAGVRGCPSPSGRRRIHHPAAGAGLRPERAHARGHHADAVPWTMRPGDAGRRLPQDRPDRGGPGDGSILIYADRRAIVERYETIMARTTVARLVGYPGQGRQSR